METIDTFTYNVYDLGLISQTYSLLASEMPSPCFGFAVEKAKMRNDVPRIEFNLTDPVFKK